MEKLNYFTGDFGAFELLDSFTLLDKKERKYELENFIKRYLVLSKEEKFAYVEHALVICDFFKKEIDKTTEKKFLESIGGIILKTQEKFEGFLISYYLDILFHYMFKVNKTDCQNVKLRMNLKNYLINLPKSLIFLKLKIMHMKWSIAF